MYLNIQTQELAHATHRIEWRESIIGIHMVITLRGRGVTTSRIQPPLAWGDEGDEGESSDEDEIGDDGVEGDDGDEGDVMRVIKVFFVFLFLILSLFCSASSTKNGFDRSTFRPVLSCLVCIAQAYTM